MEKNENPKIEDIIKLAKKRNRDINTNLINTAFEYAAEKHKEQKRKSGEPYIIHPLHVAYIVADLGLDEEVICAALLHDVVEDTDATREDIVRKFGKPIADLVDGVTKMTREFESIEEKQTENYKKMFVAMEKDIRVILLKISDRLHNVSTLEHLKREKQIIIANETMDVYAPIANKLGMYEMKCKLEKYAFKILYPEEYERINTEVEKLWNENIKNLEKTKKALEIELKKRKIPAILNIETKNIYNIYKKERRRNQIPSEMKDLFSIKIIVRDRKSCYVALGLVNTIYRLIPETFKDYIAVPRINMYQALHSTLIGENGVIFESQICSEDMHKLSRYGIVAYMQYLKERKSDSKTEDIYKEKFKGIQNSLEFEKNISNPKEFLETLKAELFEDEIYVFTRKGEIKALPKGSTPIDFAYSISDELGKHISKCRINSVNKPLTTILKSENIVEILTQDEEVIPDRSWLEAVKTAKAKTEILKLIEKIEENKPKEQKIKIKAKYRVGLVLDITMKLNDKDVNITSLNLETIDEQNVEITLAFEGNLENVIEKIEQVEDVIKVETLCVL